MGSMIGLCSQTRLLQLVHDFLSPTSSQRFYPAQAAEAITRTGNFERFVRVLGLVPCSRSQRRHDTRCRPRRARDGLLIAPGSATRVRNVPKYIAVSLCPNG